MRTGAKLTVISTLSIWLLAGCAPELVINPNFVAPDFTPSRVNELVILPAVDLRQDRSALADDIQDMMITPSGWGREEYGAKNTLSEKGYTVRFVSSLGVASVSEDDLAVQSVEWVKDLGPDDGRWVILIALNDLAETGGFGASWSASCSGYMFDKSTGNLVWRHDEITRLKMGGLIALAVSSLMRQDAMVLCSSELFKQIPVRHAAE